MPLSGTMTNSKMHFALVILSSFSFIATALAQQGYEVPTATIEVFYPKGFQVSIPHEEGITLFAFHGKLNEEMDGLEAGTWARDIVKPKNGRWIFRDRITQLQLGDTLYYWTYVIYKGLGYREDDGVYVVKEYVNTTRTSAGTTESPQSPTHTTDENNKAGGSCSPSATTVNGAPIRCAGQLVFKEEFEGNSLDNNYWTVERRIPRAPNHEFCLYLNDAEDVLKLSNGIVHIKPKSSEQHYGHAIYQSNPLILGTSCTGQLDSDECSLTPSSYKIIPPYVSAQFSSKKKFSFKYGMVEVKAKMPHAMWVFPQLWLEPNDPKYGENNYYSGQMRIAQLRLDGDKEDLIAGLVFDTDPAWYSLKLCLNQMHQLKLSENFNIYQMLWTSDLITFSLNNKEYCRHEIKDTAESFQNLQVNGKYLPQCNLLKSGSKWAPFDEEFYLRIGEGIGGFNDFPKDKISAEKPWIDTDPWAMKKFRHAYRSNNTWLNHADFQIDYIKVFSV
ncbi:gram-negative bacteria binding protein 3 [Musca autumnalis]|uniref:gram-negative bacteria binding protein 3 n=1 Tax=Musca autumnalis TaxID=221902 RepID=UPI003CF6D00B